MTAKKEYMTSYEHMTAKELSAFDCTSQRRKYYDANRASSDKKNVIWESFIKKQFPSLSFRYATIEEDTRHCTDIIIGHTIKGMRVSLKTRMVEYLYNDFTLRDIEINKLDVDEIWTASFDIRTQRLLRIVRIDAHIIDGKFIQKHGTKLVDRDAPEGGYAWVTRYSDCPSYALKFYNKYLQEFKSN